MIKKNYNSDDSEVHKLLGYADIIQDEMLTECVIIDIKNPFEKFYNMNETDKKQIEVESKERVLLAQFGTLSNQFMFGDEGRLYYYIRKEDLINKNFDNIKIRWQC